MADFIFQPWMWFVAALALIGIEILAPGLFMLWLGLAAGLLGVIVYLYPLSWPAQGAIFAISALIFVLIGREVMRRRKPPADAPFLNQRGDALIGHQFELADPIENGFGRVRIDDTVWRVSGLPAKKGARVRVTGIDGSTLKVEPVV
jgi:inner membrane protein